MRPRRRRCGGAAGGLGCSWPAAAARLAGSGLPRRLTLPAVLPLPGSQKKKVKEVSHEWQLVNKQKPIWMRK